MLINTGHGHWASMMISKENDTNKISFTYNDPMDRSLNDRPDLVKLITEVCSGAEIMDLNSQQQKEGNTSDWRFLISDDLIRQYQRLKIISTEQCKGQGLNLRKSQAGISKESLLALNKSKKNMFILH